MSERKTNTKRSAARKSGNKGGGRKGRSARAGRGSSSVVSIGDRMLSSTPLFPVSKTMNGMLYSDTFGITGTSGATGSYVLSANGAYDPNVTGTGHQPLGFDQMMLLYYQYTVVRSRIKADFTNSSVYPLRLVMYANPDATPLTDFNRVVENGQCKTKVLAQNGVTGFRGVLEMGLDVGHFFGRPSNRTILNDDDMLGTVASNPVEQVYYVLGIQDLALTNTVAVYVVVYIEFDIVFWEPRKLTSS